MGRERGCGGGAGEGVLGRCGERIDLTKSSLNGEDDAALSQLIIGKAW